MRYITCVREKEAVAQLIDIAEDTASGGSVEGAHIHIVHLSDSEDSLELIKVISKCKTISYNCRHTLRVP